MQLRRQLHARSAATDDSDIHFAAGAEVSGIFQEQVKHFLMETARLMRVIQENAVLFHARRIEVVGRTAQRHNQRVIRQFALRHQQLAFLVTQFSEGQRFVLAIDIDNRTQLELEVMVARMRQIAQRVNAFIEGAGRHFVQQRFPQVAVITIHQGNFRFFTAP